MPTTTTYQRYRSHFATSQQEQYWCHFGFGQAGTHLLKGIKPAHHRGDVTLSKRARTRGRSKLNSVLVQNVDCSPPSHLSVSTSSSSLSFPLTSSLQPLSFSLTAPSPSVSFILTASFQLGAGRIRRGRLRRGGGEAVLDGQP